MARGKQFEGKEQTEKLNQNVVYANEIFPTETRTYNKMYKIYKLIMITVAQHTKRLLFQNIQWRCWEKAYRLIAVDGFDTNVLTVDHHHHGLESF